MSFQALRSIPVLESALKETLRLHPPLIILMRLVQEDFELLGHTIPAGTLIAASPRVSNRIEEDFPKAEEFDPAATSTRARRTCRTAGRGSRSAPASTAASATRSR